MTRAYSGSPGSTMLAIRLLPPALPSFLGSTMMRAAKTMPSSWRSPSILRLSRAAGLSSLGSSPTAESIMARNEDLAMFQPMDSPFSSRFPPATVKFCQNLRRA